MVLNYCGVGNHEDHWSLKSRKTNELAPNIFYMPRRSIYELPDGATPLFDATYDAIGATLTFAKNLIDQDFHVNGCVYIITDGDDNRSKVTPQMIAKQCKDALKKEVIESLITVLVGININDPRVKRLLEEFKNEAELTQYVDAGSATAGKLAKLANFVSQSISSQSQALGSGAASQILTF